MMTTMRIMLKTMTMTMTMRRILRMTNVVLINLFIMKVMYFVYDATIA